MSDEPQEKDTTEPPRAAAQKAPDVPGFDPRAFQQRGLANRLFPGPSRQMSDQQADHIEGLLRSFGNEEQIERWRQRKNRQGRVAGGSAGAGGAGGGASGDAGGGAAVGSDPARTAIDPSTPAPTTDALTTKLDEQNELLRAILASSVDTQSDARSTAQNSRTFAWAGTVIALFTLIATVISIVAAVRAG